MKAAFLYSAHALIFAMSRVNGDSKYALYRRGECMKIPVEVLLKASGVDLSSGGSFEELEHFQEYLSYFKIVVFDGLTPNRVCLVEIRTRNCICYIMRTIGIMSLLIYLRKRLLSREI